MTSPRKTPLLAALAAAALLAGCELGGSESTFAPAASCTPVSGACSADADCCSYGCAAGVCVANPIPGGLCRTSDDCGLAVSATGGYRDMACLSGHCTTEYTCREDADVCGGDGDCCSGNCVGASYASSGTCRANGAPVVSLGEDRPVPRRRPVTVSATVSDPDGDTLVYGWSLVTRPAGSAAALTASTGAAAPAFTPDLEGTYVVRLTVTDGTAGQRARLTSADEVTFTAVNTPPAVAALPAQPHASRNVLQALAAAVTDADGDAITCTFSVLRPGAAAATPIAGPAACGASFTASFTPDVEGEWTVRLDATDGVNGVTATAAYACVNDPPVAVAGVDRHWNLAEAGAPAAPLALLGASDDANGDPAATTTWTVEAPLPAGTTYAAGEVIATTPALAFEPDVTGVFTLRYAVTDRPGSEGADALTVNVAGPVRPLAHDVRDADHAHAAGKLVLVGANPEPGSDPATAKLGLVSVVDLASGAESTFAVGGAPLTQVDVSEDGTFAIVADGAWIRRIGLATSPMTEDWALAQPSVDLAVVGAHVYAFQTTGSAQILRLTGTSAVGTGYYGSNGVGAPAASVLYAAEQGYDVERYTVSGTGSNQGGLTAAGWISPTFCASRKLWLTQNGQHLVDSCGSVFDASLTSSSSIATEQVPAGVVHLDSSASPAQAVAVTGGTTVLRFNDTFVASAPDTLPHWATPSGAFAAASGRFAFVRASGERWVVVTAQHDGATRTGIVRFP